MKHEFSKDIIHGKSHLQGRYYSFAEKSNFSKANRYTYASNEIYVTKGMQVLQQKIIAYFFVCPTCTILHACKLKCVHLKQNIIKFSHSGRLPTCWPLIQVFGVPDFFCQNTSYYPEGGIFSKKGGREFCHIIIQ